MRLIDADALNVRRYTLWFDEPADVRQIERMIRESPTIKAAPVVHGKWINGECSICKAPVPTDSVPDYLDDCDCKYCYNCGAKMDKESD